jgi:hypothetical protein
LPPPTKRPRLILSRLDLLVVGISLNAGPFMSYSKYSGCLIAPRVALRDPKASVDSPMRVPSMPGPFLPRLTDNFRGKEPNHDASKNP